MSKRSPDNASLPMDRDARVALKPPLARQPFAIEEHIIAAHQGIYFMNKPTGWPTSGRTLDDEACVQFQLMQYTRKKIWAVHQLDADTSGVNVFTHRKSRSEEHTSELQSRGHLVCRFL